MVKKHLLTGNTKDVYMKMKNRMSQYVKYKHSHDCYINSKIWECRVG